MKFFKQTYFLIFPLLLIIFDLVLYFLFKDQVSTTMRLLSIGIAYVLSPRVKIIEKQEGAQTQIVWLFYKKVITA